MALAIIHSGFVDQGAYVGLCSCCFLQVVFGLSNLTSICLVCDAALQPVKTLCRVLAFDHCHIPRTGPCFNANWAPKAVFLYVQLDEA